MQHSPEGYDQNYEEIEYLNLGMVNEALVTMQVEPTLEAEMREGQLEDAKLKRYDS
jgi:hypothetical protein